MVQCSGAIEDVKADVKSVKIGFTQNIVEIFFLAYGKNHGGLYNLDMFSKKQYMQFQ